MSFEASEEDTCSFFSLDFLKSLRFLVLVFLFLFCFVLCFLWDIMHFSLRVLGNPSVP